MANKAQQLTGACTVRITKGLPILVMPDGTDVPQQMDMVINAPINGLVTATVTLLVNLTDTPPAKSETEENIDVSCRLGQFKIPA